MAPRRGAGGAGAAVGGRWAQGSPERRQAAGRGGQAAGQGSRTRRLRRTAGAPSRRGCVRSGRGGGGGAPRRQRPRGTRGRRRAGCCPPRKDRIGRRYGLQPVAGRRAHGRRGGTTGVGGALPRGRRRRREGSRRFFLVFRRTGRPPVPLPLGSAAPSPCGAGPAPARQVVGPGPGPSGAGRSPRQAAADTAFFFLRIGTTTPASARPVSSSVEGSGTVAEGVLKPSLKTRSLLTAKPVEPRSRVPPA